MPSNIFREYDVRGLADTELTDELAFGLGRAFAARLRASGAGSAVLGRDVRESSPRLARAFTRGLLESGVDVIDVGVIPTPGLYYAVVALEAGGGCVITGSHNPIEYNGFKLQVGSSSLHGDEIRDLERRIEQMDFVDGRGTRSERSMQEAYEAMIVERCRPVRPLKIVLDAGNGTGGPSAESVFRKLGHDIVALYCTPDGTFPNHQPDPTVESYMTDLMARVRSEKADLGFGYDGDADRIGVVDETGRLLWGDQLLALFAREVLERLPGSPIVFDVKCSQGLEEDIRAHGGRPVMYKTGHSLTKAKMKEENAPLAGEMSGHMFFQDGFFGHDDAIYASARFAATHARQTQPLSAIVATLPKYVNSPELRVECSDAAKFRIVEAVAKEFQKTHEVIDIDGARVIFPEGWGLVRASNTQPVLVLRFEAKDQAGLERVENAFRAALARHPEVRW